MIQQLDIQDFIEQSQSRLTIDVRSEGEWEYGHIPHALNLPLFNNEERKVIGTLYKQQGKNEAVLAGLDMVGPKMSDFIRFVQPLVKDNKIFVYCWRGGMRSGSMAWLFNNFGYDVYVLKGGYKSYRHDVLNWIGKNFRLIVLGGKTGSGKTEIIKTLAALGEQVIDLERLANHKGSAFGALGEERQPSTEHFENLLAEELKTFDLSKRVWLEDESKSIGRVFLDNNLWKNMCAAPLFAIDLPLDVRLKRLVSLYGERDMEGLEKAISNIRPRLGNEQAKNAIEALHIKDFEQVARLTLHYYDKAYDKSVALNKARDVFRFSFEVDDVEAIANTLMNEADKKKL